MSAAHTVYAWQPDRQADNDTAKTGCAGFEINKNHARLAGWERVAGEDVRTRPPDPQ